VAIDESAETTNRALGKRLRQVRALFVGRRKSNYPQSPGLPACDPKYNNRSVYWRFDDEPQSRLRATRPTRRTLLTSPCRKIRCSVAIAIKVRDLECRDCQAV